MTEIKTVLQLLPYKLHSWHNFQLCRSLFEEYSKKCQNLFSLNHSLDVSQGNKTYIIMKQPAYTPKSRLFTSIAFHKLLKPQIASY